MVLFIFPFYAVIVFIINFTHVNGCQSIKVSGKT